MLKKLLLILLLLIIPQLSFACGDACNMQYGSGAYGFDSYSMNRDTMLLYLSKYWLQPNSCLDFNYDGIINLLDFSYWLKGYSQ